MGAVRRGVRNAFRNATRTIAVVLIVSVIFALAIAMFVSHQAASQQVQTVSSNLGTLIQINSAGTSGGFGGGNPLTPSELAQIAATPNVVAVASSVTDRLSSPGDTSSRGFFSGGGTTSLTSPLTLGSIGRHFQGGNGGFPGPNPNQPLPITIIGTNTPLNAALLHATSVSLTSGTEINGGSSSLQADVGSGLAVKNHLHAGSTFTAYGKTITVAGVFTTNSTTSSAELVVPLKIEEALSGVDGVTSVVATIDTLANVQSTANAIQSTLGASTVSVTTSQSNTSSVAADLSSIKSISLFSLIGAIVAAIAILLMSMLMIVRERRREIGILKAFGSSNAGIVSSFVSEALTLTVLSAVIGAVIGVFISNPILSQLKKSAASPGNGRFGGYGFGRLGGQGFGFGSNTLSHLHAVFGTSAIVSCVLIAMVIALVGSAVPAFAIAKVRPAEVLRSE